MSKSFSLEAKERLKSRKAIERLFSQGKKFTVAPWRIFYVQQPQQDGCQVLFGTGVSSRNFKKAVDRNRIKRLSREAWRLQKGSLQQRLENKNITLHVFFIYTGKELPAFAQVYQCTGTAIQKLAKIVGE